MDTISRPTGTLAAYLAANYAPPPIDVDSSAVRLSAHSIFRDASRHIPEINEWEWLRFLAQVSEMLESLYPRSLVRFTKNNRDAHFALVKIDSKSRRRRVASCSATSNQDSKSPVLTFASISIPASPTLSGDSEIIETDEFIKFPHVVVINLLVSVLTQAFERVELPHEQKRLLHCVMPVTSVMVRFCSLISHELVHHLNETSQSIAFRLRFDSVQEFTSSVCCSCSRLINLVSCTTVGCSFLQLHCLTRLLN